MRTRPRPALVGTAMGQGGGMEGVHAGQVLRKEGDVRAVAMGCRLAVEGGADEDFRAARQSVGDAALKSEEDR